MNAPLLFVKQKSECGLNLLCQVGCRGVQIPRLVRCLLPGLMKCYEAMTNTGGNYEKTTDPLSPVYSGRYSTSVVFASSGHLILIILKDIYIVGSEIQTISLMGPTAKAAQLLSL